MQKRVGIVVSNTWHGGGIWRIMSRVASELTLSGCDVFVIAHPKGLDRASCYPVSEKVRFLQLPYIKGIGGLRRMHREFSGLALHRMARKHRLDVLVCNEPIDSYRFRWHTATRRYHVCHSGFSFARDYYANTEPVYLLQYDGLINLLASEAELFRAFHRNVVTIPNFVDFVPRQRSRLDQKRLIAVGRLSQEKGFERLIEMFAPIAGEHPDWRLDIYGNGPLYEALSDQIRRTNVGKQIVLRGFAADIQQEFLGSSGFLTCSHREGMPMAVLEALAAGLPTISFAVDGMRELILDRVCGALIRDGDLVGMRNAVRSLIGDQAARERMGAAAAARAAVFSRDVSMAKWITLIEGEETRPRRG